MNNLSVTDRIIGVDFSDVDSTKLACSIIFIYLYSCITVYVLTVSKEIKVSESCKKTLVISTTRLYRHFTIANWKLY